MLTLNFFETITRELIDFFTDTKDLFIDMTSGIHKFLNRFMSDDIILLFGIVIIAFILLVQVYLIYHGGDLFRTYGLTAKEFFIVLIIALTVFPVDFLRKIFLRQHHLKTGV